MQIVNLKKAIMEAREFLEKADQVLNADACLWNCSPKLTGALRRQSLELTRALAEMRKP
jgi:hypothetical protein